MNVVKQTYNYEQVDARDIVLIAIPDKSGGHFLVPFQLDPGDADYAIVYNSVEDSCDTYDELYDAWLTVEADHNNIAIVQRMHQHDTGVDVLAFYIA